MFHLTRRPMATIAFGYVVGQRHRLSEVADAVLEASVCAGDSPEMATSVRAVALVGE